MDYYIQGSNIIVENTADFLPLHTLECGQVFRYTKQKDCYQLLSKNLICILKSQKNRVIIESDAPKYFIDYFDLDNNYHSIKAELGRYQELQNAIKYGYGIRILRQWELEVIISFIISSNNNIRRIQNIIENICRFLGEDMGGWYTFPTLEALAQADSSLFREAGAGYRAEYLVDTIATLKKGGLDGICGSVDNARRLLTQLKGVGRKVADCILLFGYGYRQVFPVDTWIDKAYTHLIGKTGQSREKMSNELSALFGEYAGYAQQYLFYYYRETYKNMEDK